MANTVPTDAPSRERPALGPGQPVGRPGPVTWRASPREPELRCDRIGVADASSVVLAARYQTQTIVTLDHRHFELLRPLTGGRFTILP